MLENLNTNKIIFYHIPKTAGTNFTYVLENNYKHCKKSNFAFVNSKGNPECFFGHAAFTNVLRHPDATMFIFLRDPVERVISHYVEHKNNKYIEPDFTLEEMFLEKSNLYFPKDKLPPNNLAKRAGFANITPWGSNFYTRAIHGTGFYGKEPYPLTNEHSNIVINNINNNCLEFSFQNKLIKIPTVFGITERFKESVDLFAKVAGWKRTDYVEKSIGRAYSAKRRYNASPELIDKITEHNQLDMDIYNAAKQVFEKQLEFFKGKDG